MFFFELLFLLRKGKLPVCLKELSAQCGVREKTGTGTVKVTYLFPVLTTGTVE